MQLMNLLEALIRALIPKQRIPTHAWVVHGDGPTNEMGGLVFLLWSFNLMILKTKFRVIGKLFLPFCSFQEMYYSFELQILVCKLVCQWWMRHSGVHTGIGILNFLLNVAQWRISAMDWGNVEWLFDLCNLSDWFSPEQKYFLDPRREGV